MQPADECEYKDVLIAVGDFGKLALKVADVGLEAITLPHPDGEEVMVVLLGLPARGILGEERFGYLFEVVERVGQWIVELI